MFVTPARPKEIRDIAAIAAAQMVIGKTLFIIHDLLCFLDSI
jgi:hypothetical protein